MRNEALLTAVVVAFALVNNPAPGSPIQWTIASGGNDHWYDVVCVGADISWHEAYAEVDPNQTFVKHLAMLTSEAENDFVYSNLLANNPEAWNGDYGPWIGLWQVADRDHNEGWYWVDGTPLDYSNWGNTFGDKSIVNHEDFGNFHGGNYWNDAFDYDPVQSYVWESIVPEPSTLSLLILGGLAMLRRKER